MTEWQFLRPWWFLALLPLAALLAALWRAGRRGDAWRGLVDAHLLPHLLVGAAGQPRRLPLALLALGWLMAVTALAGPVHERLPQPVFAATAKRVILLDLSPSMNAADLSPTRLARARFEVLDLLAATREGQVALVAFGPDPFIVSPLSGDAKTIAAQVPQLSTDLLPVPGPRRTERALAMAGELLTQAGARHGEVILVTDGLGGAASSTTGSAAGYAAEAAARTLADAGHRVSVLGVGTAQGAPVPDAGGGFTADRGGAIPMSRLDREGLAELARAGGGRYVELDAGDADTRALTATVAADLAAREDLERQDLSADQWREEGPWLLLLLLPLAAFAFRRGWLLPALAAVFILPPHPAQALDWAGLWQRPDQQGSRLLDAGDAPAAAARFADPDWRAAARYRGGDYAGALADLEGRTGPEADYNRGNALTRLGRLDEAIAAYQKTLDQDPAHPDASANLDLVKRLKEQQQPEQQGGQGKPDQKQQQDQQQQQDQNGQQVQQGRQGQQGQQGQSGQQDQQGQAGQEGQQGQSGQQDQQGQSGQQDQQGQPGQDQQDKQAGQGQQDQSAQESGQDRKDDSPRGDQAARTGQAGQPDAGDLTAGTPKDEALVRLPESAKQDTDQEGKASATPVTARPADGTPAGRKAAAQAPGVEDLDPREREQRQSMEAQLRRVPDDPAGLLRQRFRLQQLRREGRLP